MEPAARSLLGAPPPEGRLAAARAAARLAPDLPAAQMALARALFADLDVFGGIQHTLAAFRAFGHNLEAALWLLATASQILAWALALGGALYLAVAALGCLREAAHDLGDRLSEETPGFARAALLAVALLGPAALGEGALGLVLALLVLVTVYGGRGERIAGLAAALAVVVGLHPLLERAGQALGSVAADPVAIAAHAAEQAAASPLELARLEAVTGVDPLAARALALGVKRTGDLAGADARYQALLDQDPANPVLLNNAANVRLALGDTTGAIELYQAAIAREPSATAWFNLSQAWGVALRVVELDAALAEAQRLDSGLVGDLSDIQGRATHFVADLPIPTHVLLARMLSAADGHAVADVLRAPWAPGRLGDSALAAFGGVLGAFALGLALQSRFRPSGRCDRCRARVCPRCDGPGGRSGMCEACTRVFHRPETTDPALRTARFDQVARRQARQRWVRTALAVAVPAAGGVATQRTGLALTGAFSFALAAVCWLLRNGAAPDPLAAGAAGTVALLALAALAAAVYLASMAVAVAAARSS